jgi:hypothetical protein
MRCRDNRTGRNVRRRIGSETDEKLCITNVTVTRKITSSAAPRSGLKAEENAEASHQRDDAREGHEEVR